MESDRVTEVSSEARDCRQCHREKTDCQVHESPEAWGLQSGRSSKDAGPVVKPPTHKRGPMQLSGLGDIAGLFPHLHLWEPPPCSAPPPHPLPSWASHRDSDGHGERSQDTRDPAEGRVQGQDHFFLSTFEVGNHWLLAQSSF